MIFHTNIEKREIWSDVIWNGKMKNQFIEEFTSRHNKEKSSTICWHWNLLILLLHRKHRQICSDKTLLHIGIYVSEKLFHIYLCTSWTISIEFSTILFNIQLYLCCVVEFIQLHKIGSILKFNFPFVLMPQFAGYFTHYCT